MSRPPSLPPMFFSHYDSTIEKIHQPPFRAALYVCAQCGGAIAGAALVYGIHGAHNQFEEASVANFGLEFILTFIVVFTYFSATNPHRLVRSMDPGVTVSLNWRHFLYSNPQFSESGGVGLHGDLDLLQGSAQPRESSGPCLRCQSVQLPLVRLQHFFSIKHKVEF